MPHHGTSPGDLCTDNHFSPVYQVSSYVEIVVYHVSAGSDQNCGKNKKNEVIQGELKPHSQFLGWIATENHSYFTDKRLKNSISDQYHGKRYHNQVSPSY